MFEQRPPREITEIINFPQGSKYEFNKAKFYNNAVERADKLRLKYKKSHPKIITYEVGDKVLLKNRELPSAIAVSYTHLDVYKRQGWCCKN